MLSFFSKLCLTDIHQDLLHSFWQQQYDFHHLQILGGMNYCVCLDQRIWIKWKLKTRISSLLENMQLHFFMATYKLGCIWVRYFWKRHELCCHVSSCSATVIVKLLDFGLLLGNRYLFKEGSFVKIVLLPLSVSLTEWTNPFSCRVGCTWRQTGNY